MYLRKTEEGAPAAGGFEGWPDDLSELRLLDPCCGSGHFLVAAFLMLAPMRMALENLSASEAVDAVLRDNLHGLELDPRCVALAAFSLALAAWTWPGAGGHRTLPKLNLACSGLAPNAAKEQWLALVEPAAAAGGMPPERDLFGVDDSLLSAPLRNGLEALYDLFAQTPELGSLIDPGTLKGNLFQSGFDSVRALLAAALDQERTTDEQTERAVAAQGMARAAELLTNRYTCVITNVPYLARGKQGERLRAFCERHYPDAKNDLATVFLERCLELCAEGGTAGLVLPQNWLFLTSYRNLRKKLLKTETWHLLARLGPGAFETISGEVVKVVLFTVGNAPPAASASLQELDVSEGRGADAKAQQLREVQISRNLQSNYLSNSDCRIVSAGGQDLPSLSRFATALHGQSVGDNPAFNRCFWEIPKIGGTWEFYQVPPETTAPFVGRVGAVLWEHESGRMSRLAESVKHLNHKAQQWRSGKPNWGKAGVAVNLVGSIYATYYTGEIYSQACCVLVPNSEDLFGALWKYAETGELEKELRKIDQGLAVSVKTVLAVSFDIERWMEAADKEGFRAPDQQYTVEPNQWVFHGNPRDASETLQVAVSKLLGYRWPAENEVAMPLSGAARVWVNKSRELDPFEDDDGIVCIPSVRSELPAHERLLHLLHAAWGEDWTNDVLAKLLAKEGSISLDGWLRNRFFEQHCKLFHHRPFVWHVWDGRKRDGFHALVNYHKLAEDDGKGRRLLESLTYSYLGDWISRQQDGVQQGAGGAEDRLAAALELQKRLKAILEGEPPFDLFVRWKPIEEQPIGWEPDINDGVRLNIRPFLADDIPGGKKGAGVLRTKPNIHWRKDRGKEPQSLREQEQFPWFWKDGKFTAERVNHVNLTIAEKRAARARAGR